MEERKYSKITPKNLIDYCLAHSDGEPELLKELHRKTREWGDIKMMSGVYLGRTLSLLSKIIRPQTILELGTFTGYGTLCLSEGLLPDGLIYTIEKNVELKGFADEFFERADIAGRVIQKIGDAAEIIPFLDARFDLVFIDAAKRQYIKYYEAIMPKLNKGAVMLVDNVLWKGEVVEEECGKIADGLKKFNSHVSNDPRVQNVLLPIDDGLNMIIKN